jgi:hypothetical protein
MTDEPDLSEFKMELGTSRMTKEKRWCMGCAESQYKHVLVLVTAEDTGLSDFILKCSNCGAIEHVEDVEEESI